MDTTDSSDLCGVVIRNEANRVAWDILCQLENDLAHVKPDFTTN